MAGCTGRREPVIACARGWASFADTCSVERGRDRDGVVLTIRHGDGGFRRLLITHDGRGVIAADGAVPARVTPIGRDAIEVRVGDERYRLPATVRS